MSQSPRPHAAILAESAPRLRRQSAALTLRIWHHLASDEARMLLFEPFRSESHSFPLIEALLITADNAQRLTLHLDSAQIRAGRPALAAAFSQALGDLFGLSATPALIEGWQAVLDDMLEGIASRGDRRFA